MPELPTWQTAALEAAVVPDPDWLIQLLVAAGLPYARAAIVPVRRNWRYLVSVDGIDFLAWRSPFGAGPRFGHWLELVRPCLRCGDGTFRSPFIRTPAALGQALATFAPTHPDCRRPAPEEGG